jgi:hypothetical protein
VHAGLEIAPSRKFNMFAKIAVLCLCLAGVYSLPNSLNVGAISDSPFGDLMDGLFLCNVNGPLTITTLSYSPHPVMAGKPDANP